jgi:putative redox protein
MVQIEIDYQGELRCRAQHGPSGTELITDAPLDNQGRGASFSPTDLVATALGTCILTTMAIGGRKHGLELGPASASVKKVMVADPTRRIGRLEVLVRVSGEWDARARQLFEEIARSCPVTQSLSPRTEVPVVFEWQGLPAKR